MYFVLLKELRNASKSIILIQISNNKMFNSTNNNFFFMDTYRL